MLYLNDIVLIFCAFHISYFVLLSIFYSFDLWSHLHTCICLLCGSMDKLESEKLSYSVGAFLQCVLAQSHPLLHRTGKSTVPI